MSKTIEYTAYPLSDILTQRIVNYLNVYRMVIAALLALAQFGNLVNADLPEGYAIAANTIVLTYLIFAAFHLFTGRRSGTDFFKLATNSLFSDIFFLSLLVIVFGGVNGGIGILLVFSSAMAAVLLPLRIALFLASFASLTIIGPAMWYIRDTSTSTESMLHAGLFGSSALR